MIRCTKKSAFSLIEISIVILIIGILVAGVTQGSKLVSKFKLATARSLTESSPVASISGLYYWFESTSDKSFIESEKVDGGLVSTWYDINPQNVNHPYLYQAGGHQPQYKEKSDLNGLPAIYFPGDNSYLDALRSEGVQDSLTHENATLIVVLKSPLLAPDKVGMAAMLAPWGWCGLYVDSRHISQGYQFAGSGYSENWYVLSEERTAEPAILIGEQSNAVPYTFKFWSSGKYNGSVVDRRCDPGYLLVGNDIFGNGFDGVIGEIIVYAKVLSEEERKSIEKYLAQKWNVKLAI